MRILAFGATGFVGGRLVPHLCESGHVVTVAARSGKAAVPQEARVVRADPTSPGPWQDMVADHDAVINLVGTPVTTRWNEAGRKSILESRVLSTRHIVDALSGTSGKTFLCANAVGYYGDGGDTPLPESAPRGAGFLADVASAWQQEAMMAERYGHRVITPRFSLVLGNGGALASMRLPFSLGLGGRFGHGRQWFPWIHIEDLCRAVTFLLETPRAMGPVNICSPRQVTNAQFTSALAKAMNRPAFMHVPAFALRLALGEAASIVLSGQRCIPAALESMGFTFRHADLDQALRDLLPSLEAPRS